MLEGTADTTPPLVPAQYVTPAGMVNEAGVYGNRTHCERSSHPPLVLKTRAGTSRANTPVVGPPAAALTRRWAAPIDWKVGAPPPSSRGLGHSPLKAKTGVRIPLGVHRGPLTSDG